MPVRVLPSNPNLDQLKHQAKDLIKAHAAHSLAAAQLIREFHPRFSGVADAVIFAADFRLSDAQLTIAREHGFLSWTRLKRRIEKPVLSDRLDLPHHERIEDPIFRRAVDLMDAGDEAGLRAHLRQHPGLARQHVIFEGMNYFHNPSLLEFIAENPIRHGKMPENIVAVTGVILESGVDLESLDVTLALIATGSVPEASGKQHVLIDLLCDWGANPDSAIHAAVLHGGVKAVQVLIQRGAKVDLAVAALGSAENFRRRLAAASAEERHLALAVAAQYCQVEIVRILLDAGEDPNRFNPVGGQSHCTPLHQAAGYGTLELVQLLLERGARPDIKDVLWKGTPAGWANHVGRTEMEAYLRPLEEKAAKAE
ncbi:MAG: ankyrin repeat domain-containing protein [Terracidiphilus sp.]